MRKRRVLQRASGADRLEAPALAIPAMPKPAPHIAHHFVFLGERLWLDFVNTDDLHRGVRTDALRDFDALLGWLEAASVLDAERASGIRRRAQQQPAGATAAFAGRTRPSRQRRSTNRRARDQSCVGPQRGRATPRKPWRR